MCKAYSKHLHKDTHTLAWTHVLEFADQGRSTVILCMRPHYMWITTFASARQVCCQFEPIETITGAISLSVDGSLSVEICTAEASRSLLITQSAPRQCITLSHGIDLANTLFFCALNNFTYGCVALIDFQIEFTCSFWTVLFLLSYCESLFTTIIFILLSVHYRLTLFFQNQIGLTNNLFLYCAVACMANMSKSGQSFDGR